MVFLLQPSKLLLLMLSIGTASCTFSSYNRCRPSTRSSAFVLTSRALSKKSSISHERQRSFELHLFALNLFGDNNEDKDNKDDNENDATVPSWVNAIKQWPRYPSQPSSNTREQIVTPPPTLHEEKEALRRISLSEEEKGNLFSLGMKMPLPLTNLVNVEALLMASSQSANLAKEVETQEQSLLHDNWTLMLLDWTKNNSSLSTSADAFSSDDDSHADGNIVMPETWSILPDIEELSGWTRWIQSLQRSLTSLPLDAASKITPTPSSSSSAPPGIAADSILKEASNRIEYLVTEISTALSPSTIQDLILRASQTLEKTRSSSQGTSALSSTAVSSSSSSNNNNNKSASASDVMEAAMILAREQGLDVGEATKVARETTSFASSLVALANKVLTSGFAVQDDGDIKTTNARQSSFSQTSAPPSTSKTLFADFGSARVLSSRYSAQITKAADMGALCGAIYQETIPHTHALDHSIVANGTTADVVWMVTDTIAMEEDYREPAGNDRDIDSQPQQQQRPIFVRTFTVRGFDASDESVDRERLLNAICTASPERIREHVLVHSGLMSIARRLYQDIKKYIEWSAPSHRLVFTGHSVGGSIAILVLLLLTEEFGVEFVEEKVLRVFTFGSPPVTTTTYKHVKTPTLKNPDYLELIERGGAYQCDVLKEFNLSPFLVYGFAQPWDPIVRLFSPIDALYPLLGDLGTDGVTLYASGPPRSLRPILRAVVESWEGWPFFRDNFRSTCDQNFTSVGVQHVLLPEALRYLSDRVVGANVGVPPVEAVLRISSPELLPGLQQAFPLDVFQISFIPAAIRGFIHHFYPAYGDPFVEYASKLAKPVDAVVANSTLEKTSSTTAVLTNDELQEVPSRDNRIFVRNGVNKKSRTELGLGWTAKWSERRQ